MDIDKELIPVRETVVRSIYPEIYMNNTVYVVVILEMELTPKIINILEHYLSEKVLEDIRSSKILDINISYNFSFPDSVRRKMVNLIIGKKGYVELLDLTYRSACSVDVFPAAPDLEKFRVFELETSKVDDTSNISLCWMDMKITKKTLNYLLHYVKE